GNPGLGRAQYLRHDSPGQPGVEGRPERPPALLVGGDRLDAPGARLPSARADGGGERRDGGRGRGAGGGVGTGGLLAGDGGAVVSRRGGGGRGRGVGGGRPPRRGRAGGGGPRASPL